MGKMTIPSDRNEIETILERARTGDEKVIPVVREILKNPVAVDLLGGDLARQAESSLIRAAVGENLLLREALVRKLVLLREDLTGPTATPLEKLLVDRVVICWLQLHLSETRIAQTRNLSRAQGEYLSRDRDRAQKRYLSAIKALSLIRKIATPIVQVNIAKKQVNMAAPTNM